MKAFYRSFSFSECLFVIFTLINNKVVNKTDEFSLRGCVCEGGEVCMFTKGGGRQKHLAGGRRKKRYATGCLVAVFLRLKLNLK